MIKRTSVLHFAATMALLATASAAQAQAFSAVRLYAAAPGKDGGLAGSVVLATTEYPGSDDRRALVLPVLDYQWGNGWFAGTSNGVGYNFSSDPSLQYGVRITGDFGRKESRSQALRGMKDIDAKAELGGFLNYSLTEELSITSSLRYGAGNDSDGIVADLGLSYSTRLGQKWRLGMGVDISMVNASMMQSYFGVTATQAAASGYRAYTPKSGLRDVQTSATLSYSYSPRASVTVGLNTTTLMGDAADSPLVRKKTSVGGIFALTYAF